ncbi:hypothetical protein Pla22_18020 [Rubripirellula amarantea]|uniref:Thioredoxin domain-containing protein n=1 Tax=Rubripirellula amarantea TaxID=2527999 RepID=A0A5C5WTZ1_9BACT|nr:TlpA disulfide reductase family protein [Rubripirellula amarantea]TWT54167.1 hypothetical protein Pla22_18020 [Rubripirellula amarantea]
MDKHPPHATRKLASWDVPTVPVLMTAFLSAFLSIGCGSSSKDDASVVPPPSSRTNSGSVDGNPEATLVPPGSMELPPDFDPSDVDHEPQKQPAFELPDSPDDTTQSNNEAIRVEFATWNDIMSVPRQTGKITVVDLWSLSCEPCMREFPGLVKVHREFGEKVACVSANVDFDGRKRRPPEYYESKVEAFLEQVNAFGMSAFICSTPSEDVYTDANIASIPAVLIYDREGTPVRVFVDAGETQGFTYEEDVIPLVEQLAMVD